MEKGRSSPGRQDLRVKKWNSVCNADLPEQYTEKYLIILANFGKLQGLSIVFNSKLFSQLYMYSVPSVKRVIEMLGVKT